MGQETVIINEFRGGILFSELLELVDKWPKQVRRRNREPLPFISKNVIITSALHPKDVYHNISENDSFAQLERRFEIRRLKNFDAPSSLLKSSSPTAQKCSKGNTRTLEPFLLDI